MNIVLKCWKNRKILRSIFKTIYFNFHYLPFLQAVKLPILLYKPHFIKLRGTIDIATSNIRFGMIRLGFPMVSIYPNSGIIYENKGGKIIFKGACNIGNNSAISVGARQEGNKEIHKLPILEFGDNFVATSSCRIVCYNKIIFNDDVLVGWNCLFMDTDFHKLTKLAGGYSKGYGEIVIGKNNWFGAKCTVLKNTHTPDFTTISATSLLNKSYLFPEYSVIGENAVIEVKANNLYRNINDDIIDYK